MSWPYEPVSKPRAFWELFDSWDFEVTLEPWPARSDAPSTLHFRCGWTLNSPIDPTLVKYRIVSRSAARGTYPYAKDFSDLPWLPLTDVMVAADRAEVTLPEGEVFIEFLV
jgi:hypothetical protein